MSNRVRTCGQGTVMWALALGMSSGACGESKKSLPVPGGGSGGGAAQGIDASAAGGAPGSGGNSDQAGGRGMGGGGGADATATGMEPYFRAGSRLKPRTFGSGALKVLQGTGEHSWVDAETGMACTFRVGADGIERCLPAAGDGAYADAGCTTPVLIGPALGGLDAAPPYVALGAVSTCSERVYRVNAAPSNNGRPIYTTYTGACAKVADRVAPGKAVYPLTEVPLSTFVAVKRVNRPRAPHMDALVREGDDGSYEVVGMFDPVRKEPCFALGLDVSPAVCVPQWQGMGDTFRGSDCTDSVAFDRPLSPSCAAAKTSVLVKLQRDDPSCRTRSIAGVWENAGTAQAQVFELDRGSCVLRRPDSVDVLLPGATVDVNSLPKFETIDVEDGPLRVPFYGFEGVPFLPAPRTVDSGGAALLLDAARNESCTPHPFADGAWRCVPQSFGMAMDFNVLYASSDCMGARLMESLPATALCPSIPRAPRGLIVRTTTNAVDAYPRVVDTFGVTGMVSPTMIFTGPFNGCAAEFAPTGATYYVADEVLNPAEVFLPLTRE